jgi:hypothetical protein
MGPAGQSVIETISATSASSTTGPAFSGTFNTWFLDGTNFLTNTAQTVWIYSSASVQQSVVMLPLVDKLGGEGNWFWNVSSGVGTLYPVGSSTAALHFGGAGAAIVASNTYLGVLSNSPSSVGIIDLSAAVPAQTNYAVPITSLNTFAASSASQWTVGNYDGVLLDGASIAGTPRYFGQGKAWSIAGATTTAAISTAIGQISILNSNYALLLGNQPVSKTIAFSSGKVALSADGSLMGALANSGSDRTLNFYALPSGSVTKTFASDTNTIPFVADFTLATSGTTIGQVLAKSGAGIANYSWQVTPLSGTPVLFSGSSNTYPIVLSPDGTLVAIYNYSAFSVPTTDIYQNGVFVTTLPGRAVGWIDNNRVLIDIYMIDGIGYRYYSSSALYSSTGTLLGTPALPELNNIQTVDSNSVYDPSTNAIYSLTTGKSTWKGTFSGAAGNVGALAGANVVYQAGHSVIFETP